MPTTTNTSNGDSRSAAVQHAEQGADSWEAAADTQRAAAPEHGEFYGLAAEMVATLRHLDALTEVLSVQVAGYGRVAAAGDRVLRDDEPGHDPAERLAVASSWAAQLHHLLGQAERAGNRFWSEIGHIGVEDVTR
jgi:hypothetical protein